MSKGDTYRPVDQERYGREYDRIFGSKCHVCKGDGFLEDTDAKGGIIKTTCIICGGLGKLFPIGDN